MGLSSSARSRQEICTIGATVSGNELTISAGTLTLDFRAASLSSGAVTTVKGTPANLVISAGSALGTINGQASRIAILALNNAGAIELAAVNLSGGNKLDETNLISTTAEGGAGGADSANVVYSTTARSNLPYRVIGFIDSTQTTAGTWASAPSVIQGRGGQALAAMSALGYGQTWQSVARTSGTTYYNTTGKPILVHAYTTTAGIVSDPNISVNGQTVSMPAFSVSSALGRCQASAVVPVGAPYVITCSQAFTTVELR